MVAATVSTWRRSAEPSSFFGRTHGDELEFAVAHALGHVGGEVEPAGRVVAPHDLFKPRLVDGDLAGIQGGDLGLVNIDADDVIAGLGDAGARHQAHVSGTVHRYFHWLFPRSGSERDGVDYRLAR